jgi:tubulin polyglutamylase TTLL6/13
VKPEADCQGRGIFLTRKLEDLENGKHYVVQRYIARPYLLDGLKFDLRIYVLLCGTSPLTLYMYNEGLARLATETYTDPTNHNLDKLCMHLTNYAINKHNPKFVFNNNSANMGVGHKRSLSCVFKQLANKGLDVDTLKKKIKDIIIKTVITGLPSISHQYKCSQPEDYSGNMCFHILGLDVMVNNKGDPFVIEVNHTPSFATETPLDHKIKYNLIKDTLVLMNINVKKKN